MRSVTLQGETDFDGWRTAARRLALGGIAPRDVSWRVEGDAPDLFAASGPVPELQGTFKVPARFFELAEAAILHRDPARFALLYRLLWRLRGVSGLLEAATDPDVATVAALAKAVHRDEHKMHAFVRFREIDAEPRSHFVAWFEPEHHIVEAAAPFFAQRFADMHWSILTPDRCAHWDGGEIAITPGVSKADAPTQDRLEETWRTYYASIFNPARLKVKAMQTEMPKRYWKNLPEASLIRPLIDQAERKASAMIASPASDPHKPQKRQVLPQMAASAGESIEALRRQASDCRACPLWKDATQTVFGEGPQTAEIMLVGEQPGDTEDLAGKAFVGPAGRMLDRALAEAGIERSKLYVTNAVKHFKFVPRGKIRLHQKPNISEIKACRPWFERELALVRPRLVVAMGATAARCVLGYAGPLGEIRGVVRKLDEHTRVLVTVHPSYLLRLPDAGRQQQEYQRFVQELRMCADV